jgi:hypothetical protein
MNRFKTIDYSNIKDDGFIIRAKELLGIKTPKASGSYLRYGKEKACDLDLSENLNISDMEITDTLNSYFNKLKKENNFTLIRLSFDIIDESIKKLLDKLGNLNGLLQIENSNINEDDVEDLPKEMMKEIKKLIKEYNEDKTILTYVNLYMYLKKNIQPIFTIKEAINGMKEFNGKKIKLSDYNFSYMYIEVIFDDFRVSNFVYFKKSDKLDSKLWNVELNDILIDSLMNSKNKYQISYYKMLKYFFHFLKKGYFSKLFEERYVIDRTINTYNEIYDFREKIGDINNSLCKIENILVTDYTDKLKDDYTKLKLQFELKCKNFFIEVSKPFFKYLKTYFKLV